jgi:hypothetical protein
MSNDVATAQPAKTPELQAMSAGARVMSANKAAPAAAGVPFF